MPKNGAIPPDPHEAESAYNLIADVYDTVFNDNKSAAEDAFICASRSV